MDRNRQCDMHFPDHVDLIPSAISENGKSAISEYPHLHGVKRIAVGNNTRTVLNIRSHQLIYARRCICLAVRLLYMRTFDIKDI